MTPMPPPDLGVRPRGLVAREPSVVARVGAGLIAGRLDQQIEDGAPVAPNTMLAAHTARLTSRRERSALTAKLRAVVEQSLGPQLPWSGRIPPHRGNVAAAMPLITAVMARLDGPQPILPRGTARLRLLMSDGTGPLYSGRNGSLSGALQAVLAAL
jgi:hypothetical protein